jgi:alginate O-acetyltransferase complex protein AlgI
MQFISLAGMAFIVVTAIVCRLTPVRFKPAVLLVASYVFYCTWDPGMAVALLSTTAICYFAALRIEQLRASKAGSALLATSVSALVLYISFFKLRSVWATGDSVAVPLGISYYTFRLISYVVDVYWGKIEAERDPIRFGAFVAFFPHLVAGPIQRAEQFLPQVRKDRSPWEAQVWRGVTRILLGCFKKLAVADPLSTLVNYGVARAEYASSVPSAMVFYLFPLQLYMDFAALTDIAIGVGLLFGIESPENFDRPFTAPNISEFWRRFHMSLTGWLRDYVFMPLRMALRGWGNAGLALSLTINMVLIAIWHGFRMNFLVFGLIHSGYLIVDALSWPTRKRYYRKYPAAAKIAALTGPVLTYHLVAVANVFFRAPTFADGAQVLGGLGGGIGNLADAVSAAMAPPNQHAWVALPFAAIAVWGDSLRKRWLASGPGLWPLWLRWSAYTATAIMSFFLVLMLLARGQETNPFLYEQF